MAAPRKNAAAVAAPGATNKKRRRGNAPDVAAAAPAPAVVAPVPVHVSAKKQRLEQVSAVAKDVMIKLLTDKLSYNVSDAEWERLVALTQSHPSFDKHFTFPSDSEPGWVKPKSKKKPTHLKIVALDCEMCVTGSLADKSVRKANALCRVSAVDGEDMIRSIVADFIVHQPEDGFKMLDPKTDIHGITMAMIQQSKITVAKTQKQLLKYINSDTIVVGHSVYGDLASLRIDHRRVIDTAMIYQRKDGGASRATPGLKCLTKFLLNFEMPDGHDSAIDAQASMLAAKYAAKHECGRIIPSATELHGPRLEPRRGGVPLTYSGPPVIIPTAFQLNVTGTAAPAAVAVTPTAAVAATVATAVEEVAASTRVPMQFTPPADVMAARSCRLRVHRVPRGVTAQDIEQFFIHSAKVVPAAVESIQWQKGQTWGSANVSFSTTTHAQLAFDSVEHKKTELDSIGRPQKHIAIPTAKGKVFKNIKVGIM